MQATNMQQQKGMQTKEKGYARLKKFEVGKRSIIKAFKMRIEPKSK